MRLVLVIMWEGLYLIGVLGQIKMDFFFNLTDNFLLVLLNTLIEFINSAETAMAVQ